MASEEAATPADYGYEGDQHGYLNVCSKCFELYERDRPDGLNQTCDCQPSDPERWPGADFNQRAMLCRCCGLYVLPSGSRWAPFFCSDCGYLAMGVDVWNRRLIFPIGRHSLMHTWLPSTVLPSPAKGEINFDELADSLHATLQTVSQAMDQLWKWQRTIMKRNFKRLGLKGDQPLRAYIEAVAAGKPPLSRLEAFEGLCRLFQSKRRKPSATHAP
jgi:hypothetical protein